MKDDGTDDHCISDFGAGDVDPSWGPDGSRLVFASGRDFESFDWEIYVMTLEGHVVARLSDNPAYDTRPVWSPDGRAIAFVSNRDGNFDIYTMHEDGTNQTNLTQNPAIELDPTWSPDSARIAFASNRDGNFEIYALEIATGDIVRLTDNPARDLSPSWSPNGEWIAFVSERDDPEIGRCILCVGEIYLIKSDGSSYVRLTDHPSNDVYPTWSPDGSFILYASDRDADADLDVSYDDGKFDVYIMGADGSNLRRLTSSPLSDYGAVWSPK